MRNVDEQRVEEMDGSENQCSQRRVPGARGRILKKKVSDTDHEPHRKNLGPSFVEVSIDRAGLDVHRMDVETCAPGNGSMGEEMRPARKMSKNERLMQKCEIKPEGTQRQQDPPEAAGSDFWANMQLLFASQTNEMRGMAGVLGRKLDDVKTELKTDIDSERTERRKETSDMSGKCEERAKHIAKVELAASTAYAGGEAAAQWQPQHVILGGGPPTSKKELISVGIDRLMEGLPKINARENMVKPAGRVRIHREDERAAADARHMRLRATALLD